MVNDPRDIDLWNRSIQSFKERRGALLVLSFTLTMFDGDVAVVLLCIFYYFVRETTSRIATMTTDTVVLG